MCAEESSKYEGEANPAWGSREHRIQLIQSYLIPVLDDSGWKEEYDPDSDEVKKSATMLATEYYDMAVPAMASFGVMIALLFLTDYFIILDGQVYGLFISIWASMFMIFPSLKGRFIIATAVEGEPSEALRRLQAQEMVTANTGFVFLAFGFIIQVFSTQFLTSKELIQTNLLGSPTPGWMTLVLLIATFAISSKTMAKLRNSRLKARE
jgi:hypothetical protein